MNTKINVVVVLALSLIAATLMPTQQAQSQTGPVPSRPKGPCDIYAAAGDPCDGGWPGFRARMHHHRIGCPRLRGFRSLGTVVPASSSEKVSAKVFHMT